MTERIETHIASSVNYSFQCLLHFKTRPLSFSVIVSEERKASRIMLFEIQTIDAQTNLVCELFFLHMVLLGIATGLV